MKQKITDALKTKFEGVDASILSRIADKLTKVVMTEEQAAAAVGAYSLQNLLESYGDSRATEAQKTAVLNYEAKHGLKDGTPIAQGENVKNSDAKPQSADAPQSEAPDPTKTLREELAKLKETVGQMTAQRISDSRRQRVETAISKLPPTLRKAYGRTPLEGSDDDFETLIGSITAEVETIMHDAKQRGAVFGRPQNGNVQPAAELTKEQTAAITNRGARDKDAQPF